MLSTQYITPLASITEEHRKKKEEGKYFEFDLQVKVVQIFKVDEYSSEARVLDSSNEIWFFQFLNMKYKWLRQG